MLVAIGSVASASSAVEVILGLGVVLIFAGTVAGAFGGRWARRRSAYGRHEMLRRSPDACSRVTEPAAGRLSCEPRGPLADVLEPELVRVKAGTLAPLAGLLERGRRFGAAEDRVACELVALPEAFWLVERNVLVDGSRIPFLVMGATGVFVICASDGAWTLEDLRVMSVLGVEIRRRLPGYDGEPRAAMCLAFDETKPRAWFGGEDFRGHGGWVLGVNWLRTWIFGFGWAHGLRNGDIRRLDEAAGPFWDRRSTARLPVVPNLG